KSASKSAFFKLRVVLSILLCLAAITLIQLALSKASAQRTPPAQPIIRAQYRGVMPVVKFDIPVGGGANADQVFTKQNPYTNDGGVAGVGIFVSQNGGMTWTSADASAYGVQAACCDPGVAYGQDGKVYTIILDTSPAATYILRSTDGGATWAGPSSVSTPDRP